MRECVKEGGRTMSGFYPEPAVHLSAAAGIHNFIQQIFECLLHPRHCARLGLKHSYCTGQLWVK